MEQPTNKIFWTVGALVVIVLVVFGINEWRLKSQAPVNTHPCAINFLQTFVFNVATGTPETAIAKNLLTQLLEQYKSLGDCPTLGISDYTITSIGKPKQVKTDFTVPATFDVVPISKDQTEWVMASTTWDGSWVRGERVTLGVTNSSTSTKQQSYRLVLQ